MVVMNRRNDRQRLGHTAVRCPRIEGSLPNPLAMLEAGPFPNTRTSTALVTLKRRVSVCVIRQRAADFCRRSVVRPLCRPFEARIALQAQVGEA